MTIAKAARKSLEAIREHPRVVYAKLFYSIDIFRVDAIFCHVMIKGRSST
jgi:hypothetical protein